MGDEGRDQYDQSQKTSGLLELELQEAVNYPLWVLRTKLRSFARAVILILQVILIVKITQIYY